MYVLLCTSHLVLVTDDLFAEALDAPVDGFFVGLGSVLGAQALAIDAQGDLRYSLLLDTTPFKVFDFEPVVAQ